VLPSVLAFSGRKMANDLTGPVWKIDTAASTILSNNLLHLKGLRWVSKTASAGDDVEVQDAAGHTIWKSVASGVNYVEADVTVRHIFGIKVPVLDSGELFVEVG